MINNYQHLIKIILLAAVLAIGGSYAYANWTAPTFSPPTCPADQAPCNPPINTSLANQVKQGGLGIGGFFSTGGKAVIGSVAPTIVDALKLKVDGKVGAEAYCDRDGNNCTTPPFGATSGFWRQVPETQMIENTNTGKVKFNGKVIITAGKPNAGKVLTAQDDTGLARWRYASELIGNTVTVVTCPQGKAVQAIKPDGNPVCVDLITRTTSTGGGFLLSLLPSLVFNSIDNSNSDGGGNCRVVTGSSCGVGSFDSRTCIETGGSSTWDTHCVKTLCCSY